MHSTAPVRPTNCDKSMKINDGINRQKPFSLGEFPSIFSFHIHIPQSLLTFSVQSSTRLHSSTIVVDIDDYLLLQLSIFNAVSYQNVLMKRWQNSRFEIGHWAERGTCVCRSNR